MQNRHSRLYFENMYIKSAITIENQLLISIFIDMISEKVPPCIVLLLNLLAELEFHIHETGKCVSVYSAIKNLLLELEFYVHRIEKCLIMSSEGRLRLSALISLTNDLKNVDKRALSIMHTLIILSEIVRGEYIFMSFRRQRGANYIHWK